MQSRSYKPLILLTTRYESNDPLLKLIRIKIEDAKAVAAFYRMTEACYYEKKNFIRLTASQLRESRAVEHY